MINCDVKFDTNQKSETEEVGKCCEKVYSHLKHSVNIPLWTATLTFTPQKWGVNLSPGLDQLDAILDAILDA